MKDLTKFASIDIYLLIASLLSGFIAMNSQKHRKKSKWERFVIGIAGFCSAYFLTPLIVWLVELAMGTTIPHTVQLGVAFTVGQLGLESVGIIMNYVSDIWNERINGKNKD